VIDRLHGVRRQRQSALSVCESTGLIRALGMQVFTGADPRCLQLEITESMLLRRDEALLQQLPDIEATGVSIALDDFGTGHSNLGYLERFLIKSL